MKELWLNHPMGTPIITIIAIAIILIIIVNIVKDYNHNPFEYPVINVNVNLSGKKKPSYIECIDAWIIKLENPRQDIENMYENMLNKWDSECQSIIEEAFLWKKHKKAQYEMIREQVTNKDYRVFQFTYYRKQTRYKTKNYQRTSHVVNNITHIMPLSLKTMLEIDDELDEINYETTRKKWEEKNQRKLMTPELRSQIKKRDNYTCQICGKYMPDEVGLQVDHITPVSKGGKSVPSNLQVLCSICNGKKNAKIVLRPLPPANEDEEDFSFFTSTW